MLPAINTGKCEHCSAEMKIISFITEAEVICKILEHLGVWEEKAPVERAPPITIRKVLYRSMVIPNLL